MAVKEHFNGVVWSEWDEDIRFRTEEGLKKYRSLLADDIDFWIFVQYEFDKQWQKLKNYVNSIGVEIIGDIPIYMGYDSADVWAESQYFQLNEDRLCEKWQVCRRMPFRIWDRNGVIRSTTGIRWKR